MKRLLLSCVAVLATLTSTQAQTAYAESGLWDNWYVGANVGFNSKLTHNPFFSHLNPHLTLRAGKDIIPIVGVMAEFTTFFDDKQFPAENIDGNFIYSHTAIKAFNFDVLGNLNLHNLFKGYLGYQRPFEARFIAGIGLNHVCGIHSNPKNDFIAKFGFDFVFSLDKYVRLKGLEAYVEPALNYNLTRYNSGVQFNPNCAAWQLAIGVNYHLDALRKRPRKTARSTYTPATEPVVSVTTTITPRTEQNPSAAPALTPKKEPIIYTPSKVEYPKPDPITYNRDKAKAEPAKAAPAKVEPAKVEPTKVEPAKVEPTKVVPVKVEPAKVEPAKVEPTKVEPAKVEPAKVEPAKVEPAKVEPAKVEPAKVEPAKVEPAKVEPVKTAPAKAKPVKTKNAKAKSGKKRKAAPAKQATPAAASAKQTTPAAAPARQATPAATPKDNSDLPAIHFNPADNIIPDDQYDAIAKVATYMKSHPRAHIIIKGESAQAASVKNALTRRYGINVTRLSTTAGNQANLVTFAEK